MLPRILIGLLDISPHEYAVIELKQQQQKINLNKHIQSTSEWKKLTVRLKSSAKEKCDKFNPNDGGLTIARRLRC